jgi:hypothetical protein
LEFNGDLTSPPGYEGLTDEEKHLLDEAVKNAAKEERVSSDDVRIVTTDLIPIRLQHIFRDLGKKGYIVKETLVLNGKLFLIAVKKGGRLDIAPDFEHRE